MKIRRIIAASITALILAPTTAHANPDSWTYLTPGTRVAWDPCNVITWSIAGNGYGKGSVKDLRNSVATVSNITGLRFTQVNENADAALKIVWVDSLETDIIGLAYVASLDNKIATVTINLAVSKSKPLYSRSEWRYKGRKYFIGAMLHELAHAVGLGHVNDPTQIMNPTLEVKRYHDGDLNGLRNVGGVC